MTAIPGKPAANSSSGQEQLLGMSPGERLQRERLMRKLEVAEVAERLNLSPGVVRALEADDYRMLPNSTFVKGYLRSYARALDINGDDLVRSYEAITGCNQPVKVEPIGTPMISDPRKNARNVLLAAIGVALVVAGVWLGLDKGNGQGPAVANTGSGSNSTDAQSSGPVTELAPPVVIARPAEKQEVAIEPSSQAVNEPVQAEPPAQAIAVPVSEPVEPVADAGQETPAQEPPLQAVPESQQAEPSPESSSAPAAAPVATGLLTIKFLGECWVEVHDGYGDAVFSSLKRSGEEVTLRAATPINVKLGNGDAVEVLYNHQAVPFTTRPDRKVVRLTLGE